MDDLHLQASRYLKRSNNIPMSVLNYLTPKEMRNKLCLAAKNNYVTLKQLNLIVFKNYMKNQG